MANRKPSERKNFGPEESGEPDLAPMMNLICMLIAVMIFNMQMVQIYIINTTLPSMGGPSEEQPEKKPDKPPLNLTVGVSDKGFYISGTGLTLPGTGADASGPTIPKKVKWL